MRLSRVITIVFAVLAMVGAIAPPTSVEAQDPEERSAQADELAVFQQQDDTPEPGAGQAPFDSAESAAPVSASPVAPFYSADGAVTLSVDGTGSTSSRSSVVVDKPDGATLRRAFLIASSTGFTGYEIQDGDISIGGASVSWLPARTMTNSIRSVNVMADVTDSLRDAIDFATGPTVAFTIDEGSRTADIDGVILAVVYNDPNVTVRSSVVLAYGAQQVTGDSIRLLRSTAVGEAEVGVTLGVGISYSCQPDCNTPVQDNTLRVNGTLLTTSAGGQDDGAARNGALITVGGRGDTPTNPADPTARGDQSSCPRCDDELYDLSAFVGDTETSELLLTTENPSNDDNFMFAALEVSGAVADWEVSDPAPVPPAGLRSPVITAPIEGDIIDQGPFTVRGFVPAGGDEVISAVFAMQLTDSSSGSDCNGDGAFDALDDFNADGLLGTSIDCQVAALIALNNQLSSVPNSEEQVKVGFVPFGATASAADMSDESGFQSFTSPQADETDLDRLSDVVQVAASSVQGLTRKFQEVNVGSGDNVAAAIETATANLSGVPGKRVIYLLANDVATVPQSTLELAKAADVTIFAVGAGSGASCGIGSGLAQISDFFETTCVSATDPGQLVDAALTPPAWLDSVVVSLDGQPAQFAKVDPLGNFTARFFAPVGPHNVVVAARYATPGEQTTASVSFTAERQTSYVHLGDSWAAGDGIEDFLPYPNEDNGCFQSERGYGNIVFEGRFAAADLPMGNLDRTIVACSGALIPNILSVEQYKKGPVAPQIGALNEGVDIATVQAGGNDVGFGNIVFRCATHLGTLKNCFDDRFVRLLDGTELTVREFVNARMAIVAPELTSMYTELIGQIGADSPLLVVGYPALIEQDVGFAGNNCFVTSKLINDDERVEIRAVAAQFNQVVGNAAEAVGVHFVDVFDLFEGHNACSGSDEWVQAIALARGGEAPRFHPNIRGQEAYAFAVCSYLQSLATSGWPLNGVNLPLNPRDAQRAQPQPSLDSCGALDGVQALNAEAAATTQPETAASSVLLELPDLSAEQLAEVATYEFGSAEIVAAARAAGRDSACETAVVPGQQLVVRADGFAPGADTLIEVTDSVTHETRRSTQPVPADSDGVAIYSILVPQDDLAGSADADALITVEVIGNGAARGGTRISSSAVLVDTEASSPCSTDLQAAGEVSLDGGPAPIATEVSLPALTDIGEARAAMDDEAAIVAPASATVDVLANDDVDAATIALAVTSQPSQGVASVVDGKVLYEPGISTKTTDSFAYEVCGIQGCSSAMVTVTITPPRCRRQSGAPLVATIWGTNGDDTITGGSAADVIVSFAGNDVIDAGDGDNTICAGAGADDITSGSGRDSIRGGEGNDVIRGGLAIDRLFGEGGDDEIFGEGGSDRIRGGLGNDTIRAGSGADRVWGGDGDDIVFGMGGQDYVWGDAGNDTMQGNFQSDNMWGGAGDDIIRGAQGKDKIYGQTGDDKLYGGDNTDYLHGGRGTDLADGQRGKDNPLVTDVSGCVAETKISC